MYVRVLSVAVLDFLFQMAVIPTRRAHQVKQKHAIARSRISAVVTRWGAHTIVLESIKKVLCFGRHFRPLESKVNLPVRFTAYYTDTPCCYVNGIKLWIVDYYWAEEWIHPNSFKLEMSDCIPRTFVVKCCHLPTQPRLVIWSLRGRRCTCTNWQWTEPPTFQRTWCAYR